MPGESEWAITEAELRARCLFDGAYGNYPMTLTPGPDGALYGTTWGANASDPYGTVFRAETTGKVTTLHRFGSADGALSDVARQKLGELKHMLAQQKPKIATRQASGQVLDVLVPAWAPLIGGS